MQISGPSTKVDLHVRPITISCAELDLSSNVKLRILQDCRNFASENRIQRMTANVFHRFFNDLPELTTYERNM